MRQTVLCIIVLLHTCSIDSEASENFSFWLEPQILDQLTLAKDVSVVEDVDVANLEPRKIDWDLKRDVAKKLEKLERRTKRAIAELIRERLAEGKISEMDVAVNQGASAAAMLEGDDD